MAELADALDSGSSRDSSVQVQVLLPAPYRVFITNLNVGNGHSILFSKCLDFAALLFFSLVI